jgi:hypothetical protein
MRVGVTRGAGYGAGVARWLIPPSAMGKKTCHSCTAAGVALGNEIGNGWAIGRGVSVGVGVIAI